MVIFGSEAAGVCRRRFVMNAAIITINIIDNRPPFECRIGDDATSLIQKIDRTLLIHHKR